MSKTDENMDMSKFPNCKYTIRVQDRECGQSVMVTADTLSKMKISIKILGIWIRLDRLLGRFIRKYELEDVHRPV